MENRSIVHGRTNGHTKPFHMRSFYATYGSTV